MKNMADRFTRILIIQTAFAGDVILTLPLIQETRRFFPHATIDVLCIPGTAELVQHHPAVHRAIVYDKKHTTPSLPALGRRLRHEGYDICLVPHRSFRSAFLAYCTGAKLRISFDRSAGGWFYTVRTAYRKECHEIRRNLSLLEQLVKGVNRDTRPMLPISHDDVCIVENMVHEYALAMPFLCVAPGSVWATKRWLPESFAEFIADLAKDYGVALLGGKDDAPLCADITRMAGTEKCVDLSGRLSFLQSAELLRRAVVLVSNDSAPVHLASAVGTPVVEIFGATVPAFGFTPFLVPYDIVEEEGLACRPCGLHGGDQCPIRTFDCMNNITATQVIAAVRGLLQRADRTSEVSPL